MFVLLRNTIMCAVLLCSLFAFPGSSFAQTTTRISVGPGGVQSNDDSLNPKISADGRFVVFRSFANNLVANDTNNQIDLFQTELATGITKRINVTTSGAQVTGTFNGYAVSANGRYVVFSTNAPGLVNGDTDTFFDIFVRDTVANTTARITNGINNSVVDGSSIVPSISSDGRYVAYESAATNLVAGDANGVRDIFVYDRNTAITSLLSVSSAGAQSNARSFNAVISGDGSTVAFYSEGSNLVANDTNNFGDVFVRNIAAQTTQIVSVSTSGTQGDNTSGADDISLSNNGKLIVFDSNATNLVAGDTNARLDVFVHDITISSAPTTTRVSVSTTGGEGNGLSFLDVITPDGKYVVFDSNATNLVSGDTNSTFDVFLYNRLTATTTRVSLGAGNSEGNGESSFADISADGSRLVFASFASNLIANDTNLSIDIFLRQLTETDVSLTGVLNLQGIDANAPNQTLTFTFRAGGVDTIRTVSVSPSGAFAITGLPRANYNVLVSGGSYLSKRISADLSSGGVTLADPILLKTGDGNRDNVVDLNDLLLLISAYNQISPGRGYDVKVDLDLDGSNDITDLLLLISNYGMQGDILP